MQLVLSGNALMALESGDMGLSAVPVTGFGRWRIMESGIVGSTRLSISRSGNVLQPTPARCGPAAFPP